MHEAKRICVALPPVLYNRLEKLKEKKGYRTVSEVVRDILREYLLEEVD